ncbi:MAG: glutamine--tRNA ligase [Candidatus Dasytiphilus stammeri]
MKKTIRTSNQNNFIKQIIEKDLSTGKHNIVQTRFPPEPNGYLHIGHAKAICLNFGIAQDYNGQCNLRFDDTNPEKENKEYIEAIKHDVKWLGYQWSGKVRFASNYFEQLYQYAIELIDKGLAYVDELTVEQIREYRGTLTVPGKNSPYRNRSIEENRMLFEKMRNGGFYEGDVCLRAKIDMASNYIVMRDPVLYRIKFTEHHQTGNKWCIYPMYDFTHCISDALEGITHSLCTLEFQDNRRLYNWILEHISISGRHPSQYEFSRLNLESTVMSKRKLNLLVSEKIVEGWDDPRMLTISGLRRRGYTAASIREFCRRIGVTKQNSIVELSSLEACIREELNEYALRAMAVLYPLRIVLDNLPIGYTKIIKMSNHPYKPEMGFRAVPLSREIYIDRNDFCEEVPDPQYKRLILGKKVRLRNTYIIKAERVIKDTANNIICLHCTTCCNNNSYDKEVIGVIHWVSAQHALPAQFRIYDRLFNVPNPDALDDFLSKVNHNSLQICNGFVEPSIKQRQNTTFQFEREGYFLADSHYSSDENLVFNLIVRLRETWLKKSNKLLS